MPKRSRTNPPEDPNEAAFRVVQEATSETPTEQPPEKNLHAQVLGRLGGLKGGKARARKLTPERRREIAKKAAQARWAKKG